MTARTPTPNVAPPPLTGDDVWTEVAAELDAQTKLLGGEASVLDLPLRMQTLLRLSALAGHRIAVEREVRDVERLSR